MGQTNEFNPNAYPCDYDLGPDSYGEPGMTLLDYFAIKIYQGYISDREQYEAICKDAQQNGLRVDEYLNGIAYSEANEMLKERQNYFNNENE